MAVGDIGTYEGYGFRLGASSGIMAAGLGAGSDVFQLRNGNVKRIRILDVTVNAAVGATGFTAGAGQMSMFVARSWTGDGSGGSTLSGQSNLNTNKLRASANPSIVLTTSGSGSARISTTAALSAGTRTLDSVAVGNINFPAGVAGTIMVADIPIYRDASSLYGVPLVLAQNEGLVIQATVPATGVWQFGVNILWAELDGGQING